jgi:hypothetical protein
MLDAMNVDSGVAVPVVVTVMALGRYGQPRPVAKIFPARGGSY